MKKIFEFMETNNKESSSPLPDEVLDLRDLAAIFQRRWIWVAGGGLLGLVIVIAGIPMQTTPIPSKIKMVIDTTQGPCFWTQRKFKEFGVGEVYNIQCDGEKETARKELTSLVYKELDPSKSVQVKIQPREFGSKKNKDFAISSTQLELLVTVDAGKLDYANAFLEKIKNEFAESRINNIKGLSSNVDVGEGWISIENVLEPKGSEINLRRVFRNLALGSLSGLVLGGGAALVADRRSDRVFSQSKILRELGYPLWLTLPTPPWADQLVSPLIGQLAARLNRSVEWRVLSIAHEHESVRPLAEALIRQKEPGLSCTPVGPLLNSIIRLGSDARPIGILIVVESGFNSSQALKDASLLLRQLSCVQSIGVVLVGVPLPSDLVVGQKA